MPKEKLVKEAYKDWNEFIDWAQRTAWDRLIMDGAKGLKGALHLIVVQYATWTEQIRHNEALKEKRQRVKRKKK